MRKTNKLLAALTLLPALADEGMWLPSLISTRINDMRAKGFRLTAEEIYSINRASMKDAVVLFDGGCTGELISAEGLLLTNHHCGYDAIQAHSSVEHDYLTYGFWARTRAEELPNEKLNVKFLVRMEEITDRLAAGETATEIIRAAEAEGTGYRASVEQMYYGNQQFLFVYEQFDDVRLVAAPPSSIGKFGGDTDNWIWPRHTGDFSLFRIYASKDNKPAAYSPDNVPYRPKKHFTISTKGVHEGDFTMIYGFPGNTQEYILSDAVAYIAERSDPAKIAIRDGRLAIIAAAQALKDAGAVSVSVACTHGVFVNNALERLTGSFLDNVLCCNTLDNEVSHISVAGIIADEMAIGVINTKTTAVRLIPAIGRKEGDMLEFGGLFGSAPIMPVHTASAADFIARGGRIPAPIHSLRN